MPEQPVKGEMAVKKMLQRALGQEQQSQKGDGQEPLEKAQKITEQIIANQMIANALAKSKAETSEAEAKAAKAEAEAKKVASGEDTQPGSPFKVKGEFNMGTIDFQAREREAQAELRRLKDEGDKQAQTLGQINQQLRDEIHKKELDILQIGLQAQIQASQKQMQDLIAQLGTKKNFLEEYTEAIATAKQLGVYNPQAGTDASVQIELKKMEFEHTMALRKMAREERQWEREEKLRFMKYDDEREAKKKELGIKEDSEKKRNDMIASAPEIIGRVIARGLSEGGPEVGIGEGLSERPRGKQSAIEAGVGEAGETDCLKCHQPIAIGPTARVAVCASCGERYPIKRIKGQAEAPAGVERPGEEEE